jgi:hypothetical protein
VSQALAKYGDALAKNVAQFYFSLQLDFVLGMTFIVADGKNSILNRGYRDDEHQQRARKLLI